MDTLSKKIGTREEVYKGIASRTAGGLTNTDIIEKNFNGKLIYISKKISEKMRAQMSVGGHIQLNETQQNTLLNSNTITNQQILNYNKNKKMLKKNKKTLAVLNSNTSNLINKNKSKTQKLSFQINKNEVKNVYYPELKGLDLKELKDDLLREEQEEDNPCLEDNAFANKPKKPLEPFTIEDIPDIDINFLD